MIRKILLPTILAVLAFGFWISPNFKEIAAGIAIFLFGMIFLEDGFRAFTGGVLEQLLARTTDRLWKSISFGIVTTTLMQSSSLVSVITISFLSAGLIGLAAGIGIVFGANLGTTTGAWLIAGFGLKVKISAYAMPMLAFGAILVFQSSKTLRGIGYVLAGLGLLFLGIHYMKEGFEAYRGTLDLTRFAMTGYAGLAVFTLLGMVATVIMQSSHATLVLIITALSVGQVSYENALALAIGANIGTTITAIIGSMSANFQGKRLALAHLVFNVVTGAIAIAFMPQMIWAVEEISRAIGIPSHDHTLKLAVFHSLFNVIGVVVMAPLVGPLKAVLERAVAAPELTLAAPEFLNDAVVEFPETLTESLRNEILHLYDNALEILAHGINMRRHVLAADVSLEEYLKDNREIIELDIDRIYVTRVKSLYAAIIDFIIRAQDAISPDYANKTHDLREAARNIVQSVKSIKHLRKNVVTYMRSPNADIRAEYDSLRLRIARLLRTIEELRRGEAETDVLDFDEFKVDIEKNNIINDGTIDRLIRENRITAQMATSLMNDYAYTRDVIWNLAGMAEILFGDRDQAARDAEDLVKLDEDDIEALTADLPRRAGGKRTG